MKRRVIAGIVLVPAALSAALVRPDLPVEELERRYADGASRFADVAGMRIHYRDEGAGPVIVLLHGTASSLHTWDGWTEALRDGFRVVRFDLPGFGLTGPHPADDYSIAAYVQVVDAVVRELGVDRFHLAGNSLGGWIAWRYALERPERVRSLVLVDPAGYPGRGSPSLTFELARLPGADRVLAWVSPRWLVARNVRGVYGDDSKVTDELIDRYHALMRRPGNRAAFAARARTVDENRFLDIREIAAPTLVLWGQEDHWIPADRAGLFARGIPGAMLLTYAGVGHVPMEEIPERTASDVRAFLRRVDGRRQAGRR